MWLLDSYSSKRYMTAPPVASMATRVSHRIFSCPNIPATTVAAAVARPILTPVFKV